MKIHRIALPFLILGIVAPGLLAPRAALAGIASTNQVNCAGVNTDNSGCTWKLYGQISYTLPPGADQNFYNLVPADLVEWGNKDLYAANVFDYNVKTMAADITGYWQLEYYVHAGAETIAPPIDYTIPAASIEPNVTWPSYGYFSETDDITNIYLTVTSQETGESSYNSITLSALS
ncbi:MAG TPA: hypothetical protein VFJ58_23845 [Armatimonadota bacterium]|nr:hypothetical protein [Armatimonadota bacterium]